MSRSLSPLRAMIFGIIVLVGLSLGGYGLFVVGNRQMLFDSFSVQASFKNAQRVEPGTRVYLHGMDAGEVEAVDLNDEGSVTMRLRLSGKYQRHITKGSRVEISSDSLFAGNVLNILPNRHSTEAVQSGEVLQEHSGGGLMASIKNDIKNEIKNLTGELKQSLGASDLSATVGKLNSVLAEADTALKEFNQGKGPIGEVSIELKQATNKLNKTVTKADNLLNDVQHGRGTLGQLVKNNEMYAELLKSIQDTRQMVSSVKQNSEAIKALPVIRSYVVDANKILNRPDCKRYRLHFAEHRLFTPGRAVLTTAGTRALDAAAQWLNDRKDEGSELVIAAFADPSTKAGFAQTLTQKQSEVVADYLRNNHKVHRMGWWWWSNRTVRTIGLGNNPTPVPESTKMPPARIEIIVFVPEA